jgi:hypothetical protein
VEGRDAFVQVAGGVVVGGEEAGGAPVPGARVFGEGVEVDVVDCFDDNKDD